MAEGYGGVKAPRPTDGRKVCGKWCRGRRPRRPAEVGGDGRCAGGMNPSPTAYLVAGVCREAAEGSRPLPTRQKIKGAVVARLCEWVADERGKGGRQPAPPFPLTGCNGKPVGIPQAANAASPL